MSQKVIVGSGGSSVVLTDKNYVAAGGEAMVYERSGVAYRIYHDLKNMVPLDKLKELSAVQHPCINSPQDILYGTFGDPVGFTMTFLKETEPLTKLFTATFKNASHIDGATIQSLVKSIQSTVLFIHSSDCLVVDMNEMNILVDRNNFTKPNFIDVGSWKTPSFPATALMESIRDPQVQHNNFTEVSDWFSWGILAFQLYINIHPFKAAHPKYAPKDWRKKMDDGVSVFDKDSRLPSVCNPLSVIPKRHLDWFKDTFHAGHRSVPPHADSTAPVPVPTQIVLLKGSSRFTTTEIHNYGVSVTDVYSFFGVDHVITNKGIYVGQGSTPVFPFSSTKNASKYVLCDTEDPHTTVAIEINNGMNSIFKVQGNTLLSKKAIGNCFYRNNSIYHQSGSLLTETSFSLICGKIMERSTDVENVSELNTKLYDGVAIQDLLGKVWVSIPYKKGSCSSKHISGLNGFRIIDAKSVRNICVIVGEKKGRYSRFVLVYNEDFSWVTVREVVDINYDGINFTVTPNGLCILLSADSELEVFTNNDKLTIIKDPPFDANMKLFYNNGVCFINGSSIFRVTMK